MTPRRALADWLRHYNRPDSYDTPARFLADADTIIALLWAVRSEQQVVQAVKARAAMGLS